jgi:hypothetical protein
MGKQCRRHPATKRRVQTLPCMYAPRFCYGQLGSNPLTRPAPAEENAGAVLSPKGEKSGVCAGGEGQGVRRYYQQLGAAGH